MPSVNDGFSYSDFTNKQDFTNKINGKGQPNGYVLTTNGTKSYWASGDTGIQGIQGVQGIQGRQGIQGLRGFQGIMGANGTGMQGVQGIQGIAGSGGAANYYYTLRYDNLEHYNTPIELNSVHDHACRTSYTDEISDKDDLLNENERDTTLTPVTTTNNNGKMVVDERSPFAFGTCYCKEYATSGTLNDNDLAECPIPALYWRPNSMSRSYTYYKDGETAIGVGGTMSYTAHSNAIRYLCNEKQDVWGGYPFVLGIDLGWSHAQSSDIGWNFSRASQSDHYLLFDNDALSDAIPFICPKIFIKGAIQMPVIAPGIDNANAPNYIMDPFKNVKFTAMSNEFTIKSDTMMLFHLCIRRFPYINPSYLDKFKNDYEAYGGNCTETNNQEDICDTLLVSLDWTAYMPQKLQWLSDSVCSGEPGVFSFGGMSYNIVP